MKSVHGKPMLLLLVAAVCFFLFPAAGMAADIFSEDFDAGNSLPDLGFSDIRYWEPGEGGMKAVSPGGGNSVSEVFSPLFAAGRTAAGILTVEWKLRFPADDVGGAWQESNRVWVSLADESGQLLYSLFFMPRPGEDAGENFNIRFSRGNSGKSLVPLQQERTEAAIPTDRWVRFRVEFHPTTESGGDGTIRALCDTGNGFTEYIHVTDETYSAFAKLHFLYKTGKNDRNYRVLVDDIRVYAAGSVPLPTADLSAEPLSVNPGESAVLT